MPNNWDLAPWLMAGGVKHSVSVARLVAYAAFQGQQGVLGSKDLQVTALASPGGAVRVWPGACAIHNKANSASYEAYAARLPLVDQVSIAPTGGTARSDLIVARVEDPFEPNSTWPTPSQAAIDNGTAEFVRTHVIPGVSAATKTVPSEFAGMSLIVLARIDIPANTTNITNAMIVDLRRLTKSFSAPPQEKVVYPTALRTLSATSFVTWPSDLAFTVEVPSWATHMQATAQLGGVIHGTAAAFGLFQILVGGTVLNGANAVDLTAVTNRDRTTILVAGSKTPVPTSMRGTSQTALLQGRRNNTNSSNFEADTRVGCMLNVTFFQDLESNI